MNCVVLFWNGIEWTGLECNAMQCMFGWMYTICMNILKLILMLIQILKQILYNTNTKVRIRKLSLKFILYYIYTRICTTVQLYIYLYRYTVHTYIYIHIPYICTYIGRGRLWNRRNGAGSGTEMQRMRACPYCAKQTYR